MKFELDSALIDNILFYMANQDGAFVLDTQKVCIVEAHKDDDSRYIPLPEWTSHHGFRLMEKFTAELKNPIVRQELTEALDQNKGVFRAFRNILEQYPECEKQFIAYRKKVMTNDIIAWYNALREEWGLEPIGTEPEDDSGPVLEDFEFKEIEGNENYDICIAAKNSAGDVCGVICAKSKESYLYINKLKVNEEYRGMGLGKTLLSKFLEKTEGFKVMIDVPVESEFFGRTLRLEGFEPASQRFVYNPSRKGAEE